MKASHKKTISLLRMLWNLKWWILRRRIGTGAAWAWDYRAQIVIAFVGGALVIAFVSVMFSECAAGIIGKLLGTNAKKDTLEFLGLGISGVIAFYGLLVFNRRAAAQDKANELTEKGHAQERFKTAVDHLSNRKSKTARIASFYELFYLAKDDKDGYAQTVLDILCAHLRHITDPENSAGKTTEEADTLIGILFERSTAHVFHQLHFNLRRVHLPGINFRNKIFPQNVDLRYANLSKAIFSEGEILKGINLMGVNLQGAELPEANLEGSDLTKAYLQNIDLSHAILHFTCLREARLWEANLCGAEFMGADLCDASLENAELQYADFSDADLKGTYLFGADLCGADLSIAHNLEYATLAEVADNEETKYPFNFTK